MSVKREAQVITEPTSGFDEQSFTTGRGVFIFADNSRYEGEWIEIDGKKLKHGYGIFTFGDEKYEGMWKFDIMQEVAEGTGLEIADCFDARVIDYYRTGDGGTYDKHYFAIKVKIESKSFILDRSYLDFVVLDFKLREKFPHIRFAELPLDARGSIVKHYLKSQESRSKGVNGLNDLFAQFGVKENIVEKAIEDVLSTSSSSALKVKDRYHETIGSKIAALDNYLLDLFLHSEILVSDEIILFLNNEAPTMLMHAVSLEPVSEYDLLLLNEVMNTSAVSRKKEHQFRLRRGQFLLWAFSTLNYDIGFTIEMNDETKVPYGRHKSHECAIVGAVEATTDCTCKLIWDNSYAKLRVKQLSWVARIVKAEDYYAAKAQAAEVRKEKRKFEEARHALKVCAIRQAHLREERSKLKVMGSELVKVETQLEEHAMENEKLRQFKLFSERKIHDLEQDNAQLTGKLAKLSELVGSSEEFIEQLEDEKVELNNTISSHELKIASLERKLGKMKTKLRAAESQLGLVQDAYLDYALVEHEIDYDD